MDDFGFGISGMGRSKSIVWISMAAFGFEIQYHGGTTICMGTYTVASEGSHALG